MAKKKVKTIGILFDEDTVESLIRIEKKERRGIAALIRWIVQGYCLDNDPEYDYKVMDYVLERGIEDFEE